MRELLMLLQSWSPVISTASDVNNSVGNLCWILCGITGLVGALRIYNKWQLHGKHHFHVDAEIAGWFGAAIFFVIARAFIALIF
jgi:uncharacterized membrane protein YeaQ/YmgE (transglycosylase-associated protein family)